MDEDALLTFRISNISEAAGRARLAFFIMLFSCGTIVCTIYNNYWTWNRISYTRNQGMTEWPTPGIPASVRRPSPPASLSADDLVRWNRSEDSLIAASESTTKTLRAATDLESAKATADYQDITISWLGIKLSSGDLAIFGSLALFITAMYYLLCVRRLSLETRSLLWDAAHGSGLAPSSVDRDPLAAKTVERRRSVYLGLRQSFVLNSSIDSELETELAMHERHGAAGKKPIARPDFGLRFLSWLFTKLTFLPFATVVLSIASDCYYVVWQEGSASFAGGWRWLGNLSPEFRTQLFLMELFAIALGILILRMNLTTVRFENDATLAISAFKRGDDMRPAISADGSA